MLGCQKNKIAMRYCEKLRTIRENVDDLVKSRIKSLYTRKGVSKKDTMMNLTKKYKVSGNNHPAYIEWEDEKNDYTECN